jgi:hypothetical protein
MPNLMFMKSWQNKEVVGITGNMHMYKRPISVHLAGSGSFAEGCELVYKVRKTTDKYHGKTNSDI